MPVSSILEGLSPDVAEETPEEARRRLLAQRMQAQPAATSPGVSPGIPTVSMPSANPMVAGVNGPQSLSASLAPNRTLSELDERVAAVNRLLGPAPQQPHVGHAFDARGNLVVDPTAALEHQNYQTQVADRAARMQSLLGHLGGMEQQGTAAYNAITGRLGVTNQGNTEQARADERGVQAYTAALNQSMQQYPNRSPAEHHDYASSASGVRSARYLQLISSSGTANPRGNLPGSVATAPAGTPVVTPIGPQEIPRNALGFGTTSDTSSARPWAGIQNQLDEASGYVPANRTGQNPTPEIRPSDLPRPRTIGEFISRLENRNPGMLAENLPAIRNYIADRWSEPELNRAEGSSLARQIIGTLVERLRGSSAEDLGLSAYGNLLRTVHSHPGNSLQRRHENFLRSQRNQPPITE